MSSSNLSLPIIDVLAETDFTDEQMFSVSSFTGPIEFSAHFVPRPQISHVVFDFDGTLSWLRHGWPEIMAKLFREHIKPVAGESESQLHQLLLEEILSLNGRPSIYQMERCVQLARERGGAAPAPEQLLTEYQRRLDEKIQQRTDMILTGEVPCEQFVVYGARALLDLLDERGMQLFILSGTIEHRVRTETALLDLTRYFRGHIYGSGSQPAQFSKQATLERLLSKEKITPVQLLSFGDGPVEIELTKQIGGMAVGVASDEEHNGSGRMDALKRRQLFQAGADVLIADYRDANALVECLIGK
jgi:phosphoglycolate phosphatase-like HAD superfamily hydrolase